MMAPEEIREGLRIELDGDYGTIDVVHLECFTIEWGDGSCVQTVPYNWKWLPDMRVVQENSEVTLTIRPDLPEDFEERH